jgi:transcriptional regulator with XRE-family HTH domain
MSRIGFKIRKLRESKDYTQEYMSSLLDISQNVYSKIESGAQKLTTERLKKIAEILDVKQEELINDDLKIFNIYNNNYGYIETLKEENKVLIKKLTDQLGFLQEQNKNLTRIIEKLTD